MTDQQDFNSLYNKGMQPVTHLLTESALERMRTSAIGGSSVSFAIVLVLLQTGVASTSLKIALFTASLAIPAWVVAWQFVEAYMVCGKPSMGHFNSPKGSGVAVMFATTGMFLLLVSICSLIWHMSVIASLLFFVASLVMAIVVFKHHNAVRSYADKANSQNGV